MQRECGHQELEDAWMAQEEVCLVSRPTRPVAATVILNRPKDARPSGERLNVGRRGARRRRRRIGHRAQRRGDTGIKQHARARRAQADADADADKSLAVGTLYTVTKPVSSSTTQRCTAASA